MQIRARSAGSALVAGAVTAVATWPREPCVRTASDPPGPAGCSSWVLPDFMASVWLAVGLALLVGAVTLALLARRG